MKKTASVLGGALLGLTIATGFGADEPAGKPYSGRKEVILPPLGAASQRQIPSGVGTILSLHPDNPHYLLWCGKPTVLVTSGEHYGAGNGSNRRLFPLAG
jgi:hypothetical protein